MTGSEASPSFRLAYVPGVTPAKWVRIWNERLPDVPLDLVAVTAAEAPDLLRAGGADAGFVRLPVDRTVFSAIPLYTETTVVVVPKDHLVTAADEVTSRTWRTRSCCTRSTTSSTGSGRRDGPRSSAPPPRRTPSNWWRRAWALLVVPQSLARLHHRRDLTYRPVTDAPQSSVALSWPEEATTDMVEDFIGIVRGRTVNSSRGRQPAPAEAKRKRPERKPAAAKSAGKPARRAAALRSAGSRAGSPDAAGVSCQFVA